MQKSLSRLGWSKRARVTCHTWMGDGNDLRRNTLSLPTFTMLWFQDWGRESSPTILHDFPGREVVGPG